MKKIVLVLLLALCCFAGSAIADEPEWVKESKISYCPLCWHEKSYTTAWFYVRTIEPTCTEQGYKQRFCARNWGMPSQCLRHEYSNYKDALGHEHVQSDYLAPTATVAGYTEFSCIRCDDTYKEPIPALGGPVNPPDGGDGGNGDGNNNGGNAVNPPNGGAQQRPSDSSSDDIKADYPKAVIGNCREWVSARVSDSTKSEVLGKIYLGEEVEILRWNKDKTWARVVYNDGNNAGWVLGKYLIAK